MKLDAETIMKIIRGAIGVVLIAVGVIYQSYVWMLGAFLLMGAFGIGCGFGNSSCSTNLPKETTEEKQEKLEL